MKTRTWPVLAVAAVGLLAGAARYIKSGMDIGATVGFSAGLILLGVWICAEVTQHKARKLGGGGGDEPESG